MAFDRAKFEAFLLDSGVVGFHDSAVTLKSGRSSHWYVNWRRVTNDVFLLDRLADWVIEFARESALGADTFYGVPEGATKTGIIIQYKWAKQHPHFQRASHVLSMGRAAPKAHGDPADRFFVGVPTGRTVVIEDVTTTGGSLVAAIEQLLAAKVDVVAAIGLTNRYERPVEEGQGRSVEERIQKKFGGAVKYYSLSSAQTLLPVAVEKLHASPAVREALRREYQEYGVGPLTLP